MENNMMQMMQQMMAQMSGGADANPAKKQKTGMSGFGGSQASAGMSGLGGSQTNAGMSAFGGLQPLQPNTGMPALGGSQGSTGDAWMDAQLDKWVLAKRQKDFATADAIRDELRGMGIDPDTVRPKTVAVEGGKTGDAWTDEQLDKWLIAKKQKDFATADAIRDELRGLGIDPDTVRPRGWELKAGVASTGDPWVEEQLDKWLGAKKQKDFATADAIRDELRGMGIDPDTVRPRAPTLEPGAKTGDPWKDEQLDKWLIAKKQRDFATADAIRDELRQYGIDPDTVRPRGWELQVGNVSTGDPWTEEQLDRWLAAKRQKDFATADAIRDGLRSLGVDPDTVRPRGWSPDGGSTGSSKGCGKGNTGNTDNATSSMENSMMQMMGMMTQMMGMMSQKM